MTEKERDEHDEHEGSFAEGQSGHDPDADTHGDFAEGQEQEHHEPKEVDRKSTRLNSSH